MAPDPDDKKPNKEFYKVWSQNSSEHTNSQINLERASVGGKSGRSDTAGDRQGYDWNLVYGSVKRMNTSIVTHSGRKETRKKGATGT